MEKIEKEMFIEHALKLARQFLERDLPDEATNGEFLVCTYRMLIRQYRHIIDESRGKI